MPSINRPGYLNVTWLVAISAIIFISLNIIRMNRLSVTYDEALTYNTYVTSSYQAIVNYDNPAANNHILNTLLTKFFIGGFCNNVFFLRFANLLAQILYLAFSLLISKLLFKNRWQVVGGFLLLNLHPFLFEFWGLCRGYGLSVSFMLGSVYFLLCYLTENSVPRLIASLALCTLAIYSNFTLLNIFPALAAVIILQNLHSWRKPKFKHFFFVVIPLILGFTVIIYLLVAQPINKLKAAGQLYYGGNDGIVHDTLRSIIQDYFFIDNNEKFTTIITCIVVSSVAVIFIYLLWLLINRKRGTVYLQAFFLLLMIALLSTQLQHMVLGTKFLISRTALFFSPLYLMLFLSFIQRLTISKATLIIWMFTILAFINFFKNYNTYETRSWGFDRFDFEAIKKIQSGAVKGHITIGAFRLFTPVLQYYANTYFQNKLITVSNILEFHSTDTVCDYYYIEKSDASRMLQSYKTDTIFGNEYSLIMKKIN